MQAVVQQREQVVRHDAFERVIVCEAQADPKAVELRTTEEGFAFRLEVVRKLSDEVDGADFRKGNLLVLPVGSKQVNGVRLAESRGTEIAADGCLVQEHDDDFLVRRGWGSVFQKNPHALNDANLRKALMYVMLSAFSLSSHCFHWV